MQLTVERFSVKRCMTCYVMGVVCAIVTVLVLVYMLYVELTSGCHGQSGCGIVFAAAPLVAGYVLVSLGVLGVLFRVVSFRSAGKLVPKEYVQKLRIGQWLLLTPWAGVALAFVTSFVVAFVAM